MKQRDIMIALTQRLNERDDAVRQPAAGARQGARASRGVFPISRCTQDTRRTLLLCFLSRLADLRRILKRVERNDKIKRPALALAFSGRG